MKPILFNTEMVRAILDGRKTVTRRIVKGDLEGLYAGRCALGVGMFSKETCKRVIEPPFKVNDILYVRETFFQAVGHYLDVSGESVSYTYPIFEYLADGNHTKGHWYDKQQTYYMVKRPSIHMPKEVARIFLKVTGVRVERLQDMILDDFLSEGVDFDAKSIRELYPLDMVYSAIQKGFRELWDGTIKKDQLQHYGWNANPYVWVIEFEVIDKAAALKEG